MELSLENYIGIIADSKNFKHIGIIDFSNKTFPEQAWDYFITFHAQEVGKLELEDEYYFDLRADTFVIEYGYSEVGTEDVLIVTANHKGLRTSSVYLLEHGIYKGGIYR